MRFAAFTKVHLAWVMLVLAVAATTTVPIWANAFWLRVFTLVVMVAGLASSWNIIAGLCGRFSFGHVAFFGIGAYSTVLLVTKVSVPLLPAIVVGGLASLVVAVVVGFPLLRLRGHYFAIATFGLALVIQELVTVSRTVTGGGQGIFFPPTTLGPALFYTIVYYGMLLVMVGTVVTVWVLLRTPPGFAMRAVRADEDAAAVLGINATKYKLIAFGLSAMFAGLFGGVWAYWISFIDPVSAFSLSLNLQLTMAGVLGGLGSVIGPVLGAFTLQLLSSLIWQQFIDLYLAVFGAVIIAVVIFLPGGIMSLFSPRAATRSPMGIDLDASSDQDRLGALRLRLRHAFARSWRTPK